MDMFSVTFRQVYFFSFSIFASSNPLFYSSSFYYYFSLLSNKEIGRLRQKRVHATYGSSFLFSCLFLSALFFFSFFCKLCMGSTHTHTQSSRYHMGGVLPGSFWLVFAFLMGQSCWVDEWAADMDGM